VRRGGGCVGGPVGACEGLPWSHTAARPHGSHCAPGVAKWAGLGQELQQSAGQVRGCSKVRARSGAAAKCGPSQGLQQSAGQVRGWSRTRAGPPGSPSARSRSPPPLPTLPTQPTYGDLQFLPRRAQSQNVIKGR